MWKKKLKRGGRGGGGGGVGGKEGRRGGREGGKGGGAEPAGGGSAPAPLPARPALSAANSGPRRRLGAGPAGPPKELRAHGPRRLRHGAGRPLPQHRPTPRCTGAKQLLSAFGRKAICKKKKMLIKTRSYKTEGGKCVSASSPGAGGEEELILLSG